MCLSPIPEMQRTSIKMTCPPPPCHTRRDLSIHLQMHHVKSIFAPLPFDRQGGTVTRESRVLMPRPIYGTSKSVLASLERLASVLQHEQQQRYGLANDSEIIESNDPQVHDSISLKVKATATNIKNPRRHSSCNSAA